MTRPMAQGTTGRTKPTPARCTLACAHVPGREHWVTMPLRLHMVMPLRLHMVMPLRLHMVMPLRLHTTLG